MSEVKNQTSNVTDLRNRDPYSRPIGERMEEKKLLPVGWYYAKIVDQNLNYTSKTKPDGTPGTRAWIYYVSLREPVSPTPEQLKELEGITLDLYEFPDRRFPGLSRCIVWRSPSPESVNRNREFFENMGFNKSKPMEECANEMLGKDVLVELSTEEREYQARDGSMRTNVSNVVTSLTRDPRKK